MENQIKSIYLKILISYIRKLITRFEHLQKIRQAYKSIYLEANPDPGGSREDQIKINKEYQTLKYIKEVVLIFS